MKILGKYFDGISSKPIEAELIDDIQYIRIVSNTNDLNREWDKVYVKFRSYNQFYFHFSYEKDDIVENFEAKLTSEEEFRNLNTHFKYLQNDIATNIVSNGVKVLIPIAIFIVGFILFAYTFALPYLSDRLADQISPSLEINLGDKISKVIESEKDIKFDKSKSKLLDQYMQTLQIKSKYNYHLNYIIDENVNAFAIPGGHIYIYSGIVEKMKSYEELSALIYHEMAHIEHKHTLKGIVNSMSSSMFLSIIMSDINGAVTFIVDNANTVYQLKYSKELETDADLFAHEQLLKSKTDIQGMIDLFKVLKLEEEEIGKMGIKIPEFLSTHPLTDDRINKAKTAKKNQSEVLKNTELERIFNELKK